MKKSKTAEVVAGPTIDAIKRVAIAAMFSDDDFLDLLVLKGGNAMDLVHQASNRASIDLDFSMSGDFYLPEMQKKVERALTSRFHDELGYLAFDIRMTQRPGAMPDDLAEFWGGYLIAFKLISKNRAIELSGNIDQMRREAINLGQGSKFTIDISRYEYTDDKEQHEILGYRIYVYSPAMIVSEKIRAICQQMPEYASIIQRNGLGNQRARDFIDIEVLITKYGIDLASDHIRHIIAAMFEAKKVPLSLISRISEVRDFHALGFASVKDTIKPGVKLHSFDYYHTFVVDHCKKLESLWHV